MIGCGLGFPFWISFIDLARRRNSWRDVFDPAATRVGHELRPAVSGRRRVCGSPQGRQWQRQQEWLPKSSTDALVACGGVGINRGCAFCDRRCHASLRFRCSGDIPHREAAARSAVMILPFVCAFGDRSPLWACPSAFAMLIGASIGWGWLVPHYSALAGDLTTAAGALAQTTWRSQSALQSAPEPSVFPQSGHC